MSDFEHKHPREATGKFTDKEFTAPDGVDLGGVDADRPDHVPAWEDFDEKLGDALDEVIERDYLGNLGGGSDSVLDHMEITQREAEAAYGPERARWLACVSTEVYTDDEYEGTGDTTVTFTYVDPVTGETYDVTALGWTEDDGLDDYPALAEACPMREDGSTNYNEIPPALDRTGLGQFTEPGRKEMAPWNEAGVNPAHVSGWKELDVAPDVAVRWQDEAKLTPEETGIAIRDHVSVDATLAYSNYLEKKRAEKRLREEWANENKKAIRADARVVSFRGEAARLEERQEREHPLIEDEKLSAGIVEAHRRADELSEVATAARERIDDLARQHSEAVRTTMDAHDGYTWFRTEAGLE